MFRGMFFYKQFQELVQFCFPGQKRSGPFDIKAVVGGHAQVWTNRMLKAGEHHKVRVRAHSDKATNELHAPKETNFLVLINVGQYPF